MSDREKKLLIFFGIAGFAILNFIGFNMAQAKRLKVNAENAAAHQALDDADWHPTSHEDQSTVIMIITDDLATDSVVANERTFEAAVITIFNCCYSKVDSSMMIV